MNRSRLVTLVAAALLIHACTAGDDGAATMAPDPGDTAGGEAAEDEGAAGDGEDGGAQGEIHDGGEPGAGLPPSYDMENRTPVPLQVMYADTMVREVPPMSTMSLAGLGPQPIGPFTLTVRRADMPHIAADIAFEDAGQGDAMPVLPQHWVVDLADDGTALVATHPGMR